MTSTGKKIGEVKELKDKLNDPDIEIKTEAIRGIIDYMTNGKDVSALFMDVLKNMETPSLQLKKLIYLYVMNYAKVHPELAILGVNSFRKDAVDKKNPFLRGLAVRTMGCIRIKDITEYLCDPLKKSLRDEDPYVRKTGALCVPKLYQIAPQLIEQQGFLKLLQNLLNDGNATVVSNAIASLTICSEIKGQPLLRLTDQLVQKLLTAMNDCNEWGVVYILDTLSSYIPKDPNEAENVMERVSSRLAHTNSAVALSSIRLIIKYMDYLSNAQAIRSYTNKISAPLITMISRENEISYLVLKTINLVLQKRPLLLPKQLKIFFVNYHDALYVKLQKLDVLAKIANNENILMILRELKEYVHEVDVEFVRKAVNTMGKCAIKLEKMADQCVQCLWETLKTKISYVVQEAVIVMRDIFRKYPNTYDGLLADICSNLDSLDDPEAKASIIWIIGEYIEIIDNADELMANFTENFKDEPDVVQQQILISCMKLYLHRPEDSQEILKDLFKYITKQCENPDLRDRGYIYWRLLSTTPQMARKIVLSQRPLISDQSYTLQTEFLQKLIENIGTLSSVYSKKPEDFVKRLKDHANEKEAVEEDAFGLLQNNKDEKVEFFDDKKQVTYANKGQNLVDNSPVDLISMNQTESPKKEAPVSNLLDLNAQPTSVQPQSSYVDTETNNRSYQTSVGQVGPTLQTQFSTSMQPISSFNFFDGPQASFKNIVTPFVEVLSESKTSREGKYNGVCIKGAFQRQNDKIYLQMIIKNSSNVVLTDFGLKVNSNAFKMGYSKLLVDNFEVALNESKELKLQLSYDNSYAELEVFPYFIDCALKVRDDWFVFKVPCSMSVAMLPNVAIPVEEYKAIVCNESYQKKQEVLPNRLPIQDFVTKFRNNNMVEIVRQESGTNEMMIFACQLVNGVKLVVEIIFDKLTNGVTMRLTGPNATYNAYFNHALSMIANLD